MNENEMKIVPTPWRHRMIVWPGKPFHTLPFPYLFHRFDVVSDQGWWNGFWSREDAEAWIEDGDQIDEALMLLAAYTLFAPAYENATEPFGIVQDPSASALMAYVSICAPCLDGDHEGCLVSWDKPPPGAVGGGHCVCAHGGPETKFQRSVRLRVEAERERKSG